MSPCAAPPGLTHMSSGPIVVQSSLLPHPASLLHWGTTYFSTPATAASPGSCFGTLSWVHSPSEGFCASNICMWCGDAGHTYERIALQDWFSRCSLRTSSDTKEVPPSKAVMPKFTMCALTGTVMDRNGQLTAASAPGDKATSCRLCLEENSTDDSARCWSKVRGI